MQLRNVALIFGLVLLIDQMSKWAAREFFPASVTKNPGIGFGINLAGFFDFWLVVGALIIFLAIKVFFLPNVHWSTGLLLIVAGAVSNLLDRLIFGTVTDWIDIVIARVNLADLAVWFGLVWSVFKINKQESG